MWFKKHLNWTLVLATIFLTIMHYAIGFIASSAEYYRLAWLLIASGLVLLIFLLAYLGVGAWVLRQKGRSLLHVLWLFLGWIGVIVIIYLEHKEHKMEIKSAEEKRADKIAQDNLRAISWNQRDR